MEALASPRAVIRHSYHDAGRSESFVRPNRPPMSAGHVVIGLISAPGAATEVPSNLADDLRAELSVRLPTVQWRIPTVVYVLVHPPADDAALVGAARERRENIGHAVRAGDYLKLVLLASALATPGGVERTEVRSWPEDADPGIPAGLPHPAGGCANARTTPPVGRLGGSGVMQRRRLRAGRRCATPVPRRWRGWLDNRAGSAAVRRRGQGRSTGRGSRR